MLNTCVIIFQLLIQRLRQPRSLVHSYYCTEYTSTDIIPLRFGTISVLVIKLLQFLFFHDGQQEVLTKLAIFGMSSTLLGFSVCIHYCISDAYLSGVYETARQTLTYASLNKCMKAKFKYMLSGRQQKVRVVCVRNLPTRFCDRDTTVKESEVKNI